MAIDPADRPRHPALVARDREATAATFLDATRHACELAAQNAVTPEDAAVALLQAASLSNEHNRNCRAGIPIDGAVQQARRDLQGAVAVLLERQGAKFPQHHELAAVGQALAGLTAPPGTRMPGVLIYGEVSRWLAPDDADVMRVAFKDPELSLDERRQIEHRVAVTSARKSLPTLKMLLGGARDAHLAAPNNPALKATYQKWLHKTYIAMELAFDHAMKEHSIAQATTVAARADGSPQGLLNMRQHNHTRAGKHRALVALATDLQTVAGLRMSDLNTICTNLQLACDTHPGDQRSRDRLADAREQLALVRTLRNACNYAQLI